MYIYIYIYIYRFFVIFTMKLSSTALPYSTLNFARTFL